MTAATLPLSTKNKPPVKIRQTRMLIDDKRQTPQRRQNRHEPVGLPGVVRVGDRLGILYDAPRDGGFDHMQRDIGLSGIPVILCPFVHSVQNRVGSKWAEYFEELKLLGLSGFDVYENATCYVNRKDGTVDQLMDFSSHIASTHHSAL